MNNNGIKNRTEGVHPKYAYNLLPFTLKRAYNEIKDGIMLLQPEIYLSYPNLTCEDVFKICRYIEYDCPEIFWFDTYTVYTSAGSSFVERVELKYFMKKPRILRRQRKIQAAMKLFLKNVDDSMSDYEAVLQIYENAIALIDYDSIGLKKQERKPKKGKVDDLRSIYGALVNKKSVCAGYARAMQYLLNQIGIECVYIIGNTYHGELHAWNLLKLEGDYYYLDATWGDGSNTDKKKHFENLDYDHFCVTTADLSATHTPGEYLPVPVCTATRCNYHIRNGLFFDSFSLDSIKSSVKTQIEAGKHIVSLKFADEELYNEAYQSLVEKDMIYEIVNYVNSNSACKKIRGGYSYILKKEVRIIDFRFSVV